MTNIIETSIAKELKKWNARRDAEQKRMQAQQAIDWMIADIHAREAKIEMHRAKIESIRISIMERRKELNNA